MLTLLDLLKESKIEKKVGVTNKLKLPHIFPTGHHVSVYPLSKFAEGNIVNFTSKGITARFKYFVGMLHVKGRIYYSMGDYDAYDLILGFDSATKLQYKQILEAIIKSEINLDPIPEVFYKQLSEILLVYGKTPVFLRYGDLSIRERIDDTFTIKQSSKG
mgnify:CR=1 FL=1